MYRFFTTERIIEYPFVHKNVKIKGGKILDVGPGTSRLPTELASLGHKVWAIDVVMHYPVPITHPNFTFVQGDIRRTTFPDDFFDVITAVSTIEHVGLENENDLDGDQKAIWEIARIIKPGGRLIMSVPFGKKGIYCIKGKPVWRIYDMQALDGLLARFKIENIEFGIGRDGAWLPASLEQVTDIDSTKQQRWLSSNAVAMIVARAG